MSWLSWLHEPQFLNVTYTEFNVILYADLKFYTVCMLISKLSVILYADLKLCSLYADLKN